MVIDQHAKIHCGLAGLQILMKKDTSMGSVEALEVMQKQSSDMLRKHCLEERLMGL